MRGTDEMSGLLFSHVDLEERNPVRCRLRKNRQGVNDAPARLGSGFDRLCSVEGRRSIAPLLSAGHFSVDGTLIRAGASMKGFQPEAAGAPRRI